MALLLEGDDCGVRLLSNTLVLSSNSSCVSHWDFLILPELALEGWGGGSGSREEIGGKSVEQEIALGTLNTWGEQGCCRGHPSPTPPALSTRQELWASWVNTLQPEKFPGRHPAPSYLHSPFISNNSTTVKRRLSLQRWKIRSWNTNPCDFLSVQPFLTFPLVGRSICFACRGIKSCYDWKSESQERLFFRIFLSTQSISEN